MNVRVTLSSEHAAAGFQRQHDVGRPNTKQYYDCANSNIGSMRASRKNYTDHHARGLTERLTEQQHRFSGTVLATTHVHLDEHLGAEMIMVQGRGKEIQALVGRLQREKGALHAKLAAGTTGRRLPGVRHPHKH
jgi:hypothetical protein